MKTVNEMKYFLEIDGRETSGAVEYLIIRVGGCWNDAPSAEQVGQMLEILNTEFEAVEGEALFWGVNGKVFEVENGAWVSV